MPEADGQLFNAEVARCRSFIAERMIKGATESLDGICREFERDRSHHSPHSLVSVLQVWTWLKAESGELDDARRINQFARLALACVRPNLQLSRFGERLAQIMRRGW